MGRQQKTGPASVGILLLTFLGAASAKVASFISH
jgi:hypothetical protein